MTDQPTRDQLIEQAARHLFDHDTVRLMISTSSLPWDSPLLAKVRKRYRDTAHALADAGLLADPDQALDLENAKGTLAAVRWKLGTPEGRAVSMHAGEIRAERDALQARIDRVAETCEAAATGIAIGMARDPARWECAEAAIEDVRAVLQGGQPTAVTDNNGEPHVIDATGIRHYEPKTLEVGSPREQRCASCNGTNITYQAFSGGREYYCADCDDTFPYDDGKAPRRAQMLADGRHEELRSEMRGHLRPTGEVDRG